MILQGIAIGLLNMPPYANFRRNPMSHSGIVAVSSPEEDAACLVEASLRRKPPYSGEAIISGNVSEGNEVEWTVREEDGFEIIEENDGSGS
jgi:hypothetical protein